ATLTANGIVSGSGALSSGNGGGTVVLGGTNTYTGGTFINNSSLSVATDAGLGAANTDITFNGTGSLIFNGDLTETRNVILNANGGISVTDGNFVLETGAIVGTGGFTMGGAGTLVMSNSQNSFSGDVTLAGGLLVAQALGDLGTGSGGTIFDGGTLRTNTYTMTNAIVMTGDGTFDVGGNQVTTVNSTISGAGNLTKVGTGTLLLNGDNSGYSGTTTLNFGTLTVEGGGATNTSTALGTGGVTLAGGVMNLLANGAGSNGTVTYGNDVNVTGNATINAGYVSAGTGNTMALGNLTLGNQVLTVTGADTDGISFTGATLNSLASTLNVTTAAATGGTLTIAGAVVGSGALNKTGIGTVNLNGINTYSGGTNVLAGIVNVAAAGSLSTGPVVVQPGGVLGVNDPSNFTGPSSIAIESSTTGGFGVVTMNTDFAIGTQALNVSPWGMALQLNTASVASNLDLSTLTAAGSGPVFLGAAQNTIFSGALSPAADNVYRLGANSAAATVLTISSGLAEGSTPGTSVVVGSPLANLTGTYANGTGTVTLTAAGTYTGDTTVNKGSSLNVSAASGNNPLGTGVLNLYGAATVGTAWTGTSPELGNTTINILGGGANLAGGSLSLDNSLLTAANSDVRLDPTTILNLQGGTFAFGGSNTASVISNQDLAAINYQGANTITLTKGTGTGDLTTLTDTALARVDNGTLVFSSAGAIGGATPSMQFTSGSLSAPASGFLPANILIADPTVSFANYDANGITNATLTAAATAAALDSVTTAQVANVTAAITLAGNPSVYGMVVGNVKLATSGSFTTITLGTASTDGTAGLILNNTATQTDNVNFTFGNGSNREAIIYAGAASTINTILSGVIKTGDLTKTGPGQLSLTGANAGKITGTVTIDQGTLTVATPAELGVNVAVSPVTAPNVQLNGGTLDVSTGGSNNYLSNVTINGDASINTANNSQPRFGNLSVNARAGGLTDPVILTINTGGIVFTGGATLNGNLAINDTAATNATNLSTVIEGNITGTGGITKYGNGALQLNPGDGSTNNTFTGGLVLDGGTTTTTARQGTPFGNGPITVNPGADIRLADPSNVTNTTGFSAATVTLVSDQNGLAQLGLAYDGLPTAFTVQSTGPFTGVLGIGNPSFSTPLDMGDYGNGLMFLGSSQTGVFQGATLTAPATTNTYLLGAGGGSLTINSPSLVDNGANPVSLEVGALSNTYQATSVLLNNGNGVLILNNANTFTGGTTLNGNGVANTTNAILQIGNDQALGSGTLTFNGGVLEPDATGEAVLNQPRTLSNNMQMIGDALFFTGNMANVDLNLTGNLALSTAAVGGDVNRNFTQSNAQGLVNISGVISDGAGTGNQITKLGAGPLLLLGNNTYSGATNINAGALVVTSDSNLGTNPAVNLGGGVLAVWSAPDGVMTTNKQYNLVAGTTGFDVSLGQTLYEGPDGSISGTAALTKTGLGALVLNGVNSFNTMTISAGVVSVNNPLSLGDQSANGTITLNGGNLQFINSMTIAHGITSGNSGAIGVLSGETLTMTGVLASTGSGTVTKSGAGTLVLDAVDTITNLAISGNGTIVAGTNQPFATNANLTINGGTFQVSTLGGVTNSVLGGTLNYAGGAYVSLVDAPGATAQYTVSTINRSGATGQGTLIIQPANGDLGTTENLVAQTVLGLNTVTSQSTLNNNGMVAGSILQAAADGTADFVQYGTPAQGFISTTVARLPDFSASTASSIVDIAAGSPATISGTAVAYAVRAADNISGGTLQIVSATQALGTAASMSWDEGALLLNGTNQVVSSNLFFGNVTNDYLSAPYPLAAAGVAPQVAGEGIVYVANSAIISGSIDSHGFVKNGNGSLVLSGANQFGSNFTVQDGTVAFSNVAAGPVAGSLVLNDSSTLDVKGVSVPPNLVAGQTGVVGAFVGNLTGLNGVITNSSITSPGAVVVLGSATGAAGTFSGNILDGPDQPTILVRGGGGTLTIGTTNVNNSVAGYNTYTGGTVINSGTLTVQNPFGLGGAALLAGVPVAPGTPGSVQTTPAMVTLNGGTLALNMNGDEYDSTIVVGDPTTNGINVTVTSNSTINVNGVVAGPGDSIQIGDLTVGNNILTVNGSNTFRLLVAGTTTLTGNAGVLSPASAIPSGVLVLAGQIVDGGNGYDLNKTGGGAVVISGTDNTYSGGTNVLAGTLQVTSNVPGSTALGSGDVVVAPGAVLRLAGENSLNGISSLYVTSTQTALGVVGLDNAGFDPALQITSAGGPGGTASMKSVYGGAVQIYTPQFNSDINMANVGNGLMSLGAGVNTTFTAGTITAGADNVYRLGTNVSAATTLTLAGPDLELTDNVITSASNSLMIGSPLTNLTGASVTDGTGTVVLDEANSYSGGTTINKLSTLTIQVGGAAGSPNTPLGSGAVEVFGTLSASGVFGSFYTASAGTNTNDVILRPGGTLVLDDTVPFTGSGGNGRWGDDVGLALNGGTFQLKGATNLDTSETIGALTLNQGGTVNLSPGGTGTITLIAASLERNAGSTLQITTGAANELGAAAASATFIVTGGVTNTNNMAPAYIVDQTDATYVKYVDNTTGFVPLGTGAGQQPYSLTIASGAITGGANNGTDTVNATGSVSVSSSYSAYALRTTGAISGSGTLTLTSGGLLADVNGTISPNLVFGTNGTTGSVEALIYTQVANTTLSGVLHTQQGLTKFGPGNLILSGNNGALPGATAPFS
ncbi:MAG TPA: autotransporter-associated beta strand repeat-containing protein, partial [Pirellulales bacterium]